MANIFSTTLTNGNDVLSFAAWDVDIPWTIYALAGNDSITVTGGWKTICEMDLGNDYVRVNGGSIVVVHGAAGDDRVDMYSSSVSFVGGDGSDRAYAYGGSHLTFDGGAGTDRVEFFKSLSASVSGGDDNDTFVGHNLLVGTIDGGNGADQFIGFRAEADGLTLSGGAGDDLYRIDDATVAIVENAGEGFDQVRTKINYTLGNNIERLTLVGTANVDGTGNDLANTLGGNSGNNVLTGGLGDDKVYGYAGADTVEGGDGNDHLEGGAGSDEFTGGAGADGFYFRNGDFAGMTTSTCDIIHDFVHSDGDRIRLNLVDANSGLAGDQAFAFIGTMAFHGIAGELRYEQIGGATYVEGDTNGDGAADFWIGVDSLHTLAANDFVL
jgi:Ca2+-binding RTX toxin-like protein